MTLMTMADAINLALKHEMARNSQMILMGEDVARDGGVFQVTSGLFDLYPDRVRDTPLAEKTLIGVAIGLATGTTEECGGVLPARTVAAEVQFEAFMLDSFGQICNVAARMRNRTRGRLHCPLIIRAPWGGGVHAPEHHSDSHETMLAHVPGLRVIVLSAPKMAYGLTLAALRQADPIVVLEATKNYRSFKEEVEDDGAALPLDTPIRLREGCDLTIITWGGIRNEVLAAVQILEQDDYSADVFDLATLGATADYSPVWESVKNNGRVLIVHEAVKTGGFGAEIAARIAESPDLMRALSGRIVHRVASPDIPVPYARLEDQFFPTTETIVARARSALDE